VTKSVSTRIRGAECRRSLVIAFFVRRTIREIFGCHVYNCMKGALSVLTTLEEHTRCATSVQVAEPFVRANTCKRGSNIPETEKNH